MTRNEKTLSIGFAVCVLANVALSCYAIFHDPPVVRTQAVQIVDAAGRERALLGMSPEGTVGIALFDADGRLRFSATVLPDGTPRVVEMDQKGAALWGDPGVLPHDLPTGY